jgi:hypothetical protein
MHIEKVISPEKWLEVSEKDEILYGDRLGHLEQLWYSTL